MSAFVSQTLRTGLVAAGFALGMVAAAPAFAQTKPATPAVTAPAKAPAGIIAKGNGFTVTEKDLSDAMQDPAIGAEGMPDDQKRSTLIDYLINLKALNQAATAAKVDQSPEFAKKLADLKTQLMVQTYIEQEMKKRVTPEAMQELYNETTKSAKPEPEVRARHILVETEDQAKAVAERLKKGEDFAKIAGEVSKDPGAKENGGELGFFTKERMVAPFAEAAFKLEPNQISEPVKTDFGWHIIQAEEKRQSPVPSFDSLKEQIEAFLTRQQQQKLIEDLRKQANVERLDQPVEAAPATPAAPAAPAAPAPAPAKK